MNVKAWCRYWHFNVVGLIRENAGHRNYLALVGLMDDWFDTDVWDNDGRTIEEAWPHVLKNLNSCTDEQIRELKGFCTANPEGL